MPVIDMPAIMGGEISLPFLVCPPSEVWLRQMIERAVAQVFDIDVDLLRGPSRGQAQVALARQVAMYLAHCAFRVSHAEVGRIFGRDRTTVGHACAVVEDRRDDPVFDRTMHNLEEIVRRLREITTWADLCEEMA